MSELKYAAAPESQIPEPVIHGAAQAKLQELSQTSETKKTVNRSSYEIYQGTVLSDIIFSVFIRNIKAKKFPRWYVGLGHVVIKTSFALRRRESREGSHLSSSSGCE